MKVDDHGCEPAFSPSLRNFEGRKNKAGRGAPFLVTTLPPSSPRCMLSEICMRDDGWKREKDRTRRRNAQNNPRIFQVCFIVLVYFLSSSCDAVGETRREGA